MNLKVKFRESFRPFAPIVRRERVADYFELDADSPYMLLVAPVKARRQRPMSDADLEAKFRDLAQLGAPGRETRSTIDRVWSLDALADASALARFAVS